MKKKLRLFSYSLENNSKKKKKPRKTNKPQVLNRSLKENKAD